MNTRLYLTVALAMCLIFGCASQESLYKKARDSNTIEAYEEYLQKYPNGDFVKEAKNNIARVKFDEAKQANTIEAYERFLENYSKSTYANQAKTKLISLEFEKASQINTQDAYQGFLKKYPESDYGWKVNKKMTELEWEHTKKLNTIEAYKAFEKKNANKLSSWQKSGIKAKIEILSYQKAMESNSIASLKQFLANYPEINYYPRFKYISDVKDKLFYLNNKNIIDKILNSKNDKTRLHNFRTFIKNEFINKDYNAANLIRLLQYLANKFGENPKLLPVSIGSNSFFKYFADINYFPTVQEKTDYNKLLENAVSILALYKSIQQLYPDKYNYESAYLAHNIGRIALLIKAERPQGKFFNVNFWDISNRSFNRSFFGIAQAFEKSGGNTKSFKRNLESGQKYSLKLVEIYKQSVVDLFNSLESNKATTKSKKYILKRLGHWVKLVNIEYSLIDELRYIAKNDIDSQLRTLASRAVKNAEASKREYFHH